MVKFSNIHYNVNVSNYQVSTTHKNEGYILVVYKKTGKFKANSDRFSKKTFRKTTKFSPNNCGCICMNKSASEMDEEQENSFPIKTPVRKIRTGVLPVVRL